MADGKLTLGTAVLLIQYCRATPLDVATQHFIKLAAAFHLFPDDVLKQSFE